MNNNRGVGGTLTFLVRVDLVQRNRRETITTIVELLARDIGADNDIITLTIGPDTRRGTSLHYLLCCSFELFDLDPFTAQRLQHARNENVVGRTTSIGRQSVVVYRLMHRERRRP